MPPRVKRPNPAAAPAKKSKEAPDERETEIDEASSSEDDEVAWVHEVTTSGQAAPVARARGLWNSSDSSELVTWEAAHAGVVARHKCRDKKREVDAIVASAKARTAPRLTSDELVVFWELKMAGNMGRPQSGKTMLARNQELAEGVSERAFAMLKGWDCETRGDANTKVRVMEALSTLFMVGPATASMLLAHFHEFVPFFSEEAAKCALGVQSIKYDLKEYGNFWSAMRDKQKQKCVKEAGLSLVEMERALWAASYERAEVKAEKTADEDEDNNGLGTSDDEDEDEETNVCYNECVAEFIRAKLMGAGESLDSRFHGAIENAGCDDLAQAKRAAEYNQKHKPELGQGKFWGNGPFGNVLRVARDEKVGDLRPVCEKALHSCQYRGCPTRERHTTVADTESPATVYKCTEKWNVRLQRALVNRYLVSFQCEACFNSEQQSAASISV